MPHLVFAEQFYFPEGWGGAELPQALTCYLAQQGHAVTVVCGSDQYVPSQSAAAVDPRQAGVNIVRLPRLFGGDIHKNKLLKQLWFYICFLPALVFRRRPDIYVSQTNPPLIVPITSLVATVARRPHVIIAQDLYPEMMVRHGMIEAGSWVTRLLQRAFNWAYRGAAKVVVLGPTMADRVKEKGVRSNDISVISNWATGALAIDRSADNPLREEWGLRGKFVLLYSGNLGIGHEFRTLLDAFRQFTQTHSNTVLLFVGRGSRLAEVREMVAQMALEQHVVFADFVPADQLPLSMGLADVALVTLRQGFEGLIAPSKALGYMARGLPILYVGPESDISDLIAKASGGWVRRNGDVEGVLSAIVESAADVDKTRAIGKLAYDYYTSNLAVDIAMKKYASVFDDLGALNTNG